MPSAVTNTPATTAISRGTIGNFAGGAAGAATGEKPARTVGEEAMMPGGSASRWPVRQVPTLANLQDGRSDKPSSQPNGHTFVFSREKRGSKTLTNQFSGSSSVTLPLT